MFLLLPKGLANIVPIPIQIFVENANNLFQFQSQTTQRKSQFFFFVYVRRTPRTPQVIYLEEDEEAQISRVLYLN